MSKHTLYEERVINRSKVQYIKGLLIRWFQYQKFKRAVIIARKRGAKIGEGVCMPKALAKIANSHLVVGNHVSIQTSDIDLRSPIKIGDNVIIGSEVKILTASHNIDSPEWEFKTYGLEIEDYAWIATGATIMPSCRKISHGSIIGGKSVAVKSTEPMDVVSGNPAVVIKKRKAVHSNLVVESLLGGDYEEYRKTWENKKQR